MLEVIVDYLLARIKNRKGEDHFATKGEVGGDFLRKRGVEEKERNIFICMIGSEPTA